MKIAGIIAGFLVVVVGFLGFVAPKQMVIQKEVVIEKSKDLVFSDLVMMKNHNRWSPWNKKDPNIVINHSDPDGVVGASMSWKGNKEVGEGIQEIKAIKPGERIDYELRFKEPMEDTSQAFLMTEALGPDQTKVTWGMKGETPFPRNIICMLMNLKPQVEKEFEAGLASLKTQLEQSPATATE